MLDQAKHRVYMYNLINKIYASPLRQNLAFKWGTLCYFVYELPRFSVDLDFDVVVDSPDIMKLMTSILEPLGRIKDSYEKNFTYFFLFDYGSGDHNIKIEMSRRDNDVDTYESLNFFGRDILAMRKDCIFANKLVACSQRLKNRDLFDVHFFFSKMFPINREVIEERTWLTYKQFLLHLKDQIVDYYKPNLLLAELGDLVSEKQKVFIKKHLVSEVVSFIDFTLFNLP